MFPLILTSRFESALVYAMGLYRHQRCPVNAMPYVSHLLGVAALVLEDGGTEEEAIAALFLGAIEDQGGTKTLIAIRDCFGDRVAAIALGCTKPSVADYTSWLQHKQAYLQQIRRAELSVQRVTLADELHNGWLLLRNLAKAGDTTWQACAGSPSEILWFYREAAVCFEMMKPGWMAVELTQVVQRLVEQVELL